MGKLLPPEWRPIQNELQENGVDFSTRIEIAQAFIAKGIFEKQQYEQKVDIGIGCIMDIIRNHSLNEFKKNFLEKNKELVDKGELIHYYNNSYRRYVVEFGKLKIYIRDLHPIYKSTVIVDPNAINSSERYDALIGFLELLATAYNYNLEDVPGLDYRRSKYKK